MPLPLPILLAAYVGSTSPPPAYDKLASSTDNSTSTSFDDDGFHEDSEASESDTDFDEDLEASDSHNLERRTAPID